MATINETAAVTTEPARKRKLGTLSGRVIALHKTNGSGMSVETDFGGRTGVRRPYVAQDTLVKLGIEPGIDCDFDFWELDNGQIQVSAPGLAVDDVLADLDAASARY